MHQDWVKYFVSCLPGLFMVLAGKHKRERVSCDFVMCSRDFASGARFLSTGVPISMGCLSDLGGGGKVIGSSE